MTGRPSVGVTLLLAAAGLLAGCGSTSSVSSVAAPSSPRAVVSAPTTVGCASGRATVATDSALQVRGCPPGTRTQVSGPALSKASTFTFRAQTAGTATVTLASGPVCSAAAACPQYRMFLGRIVVTVR